jgi:hypothetical protein
LLTLLKYPIDPLKIKIFAALVAEEWPLWHAKMPA